VEGFTLGWGLHENKASPAGPRQHQRDGAAARAPTKDRSTRRTRVKSVRVALPALLAVGAIAAGLAGCGGSGDSSGGSGASSPATGGGQRYSPAAPAAASTGIPQHNGGDMDADNNGGPSDGDGNK